MADCNNSRNDNLNNNYKESYSLLKNDLDNKIVMIDGAMGTMIQQQKLTAEDFGGEKYEGCNDYLVLTKPDVIKNIHKTYLKSGSDIIETNTFGALDIVLKDYDLEDKAFEMNKAAAEIVNKAIKEFKEENPEEKRNLYVAGALGPSNKSISVTGGVTFNELIHSYYTAVSGLLEGGVDIILFETIQDTRNLKAAYLGFQKATSEKYPVPLMLSFTIESTGTTLAGQTADAFYYAVNHMHPLSIGLNCATGPEFMTQFLKTLNNVSDTYISVYPNAGLPNEEGVYEETPDTLAAKIEPFFQGNFLNIVGGCCGTTPEHIRAIKKGIKGLKPVKRKVITPLPAEEELVRVANNKPTIVDKVKKQVTIIAELDPPKHLNVDKFIEGAKAIDKKNIEAITLADNSLASTRICNLAAATLLKEHISTPTLLHLTCRDHNLIGLQSRLMGFDLLGINNVLALTGDPSKLGDFPGATSVYDMTSLKLIPFIKQLNEGLGYNGASLKKTTNFTVAAAYNPNVRDLSKTKRLVEKKIKAGTDYFITQPVFEAEKIEQLAELAADYPDTPFFVGIMPITSYNNAVFLHNEVPGIKLSEEFLAKLEEVKDDKELCQKVALEESKKLLDVALKHFKGIYLITPFLRYDLTLELIDYVEENKDK